MMQDLYVLLHDFNNNEEYEDNISYDDQFVGVFTSTKEAIEVVKKKIEKLKSYDMTIEDYNVKNDEHGVITIRFEAIDKSYEYTHVYKIEKLEINKERA